MALNPGYLLSIFSTLIDIAQSRTCIDGLWLKPAKALTGTWVDKVKAAAVIQSSFTSMIYNIFDFLSCKERVATAITFTLGRKILTFLTSRLIESNLVIRNFLVTLKLFLNAKCSLSLWSKLTIGHWKWFLNNNLFLIKTFLITKFDCKSRDPFFLKVGIHSVANVSMKLYFNFQIPRETYVPTTNKNRINHGTYLHSILHKC